MNDDIAAALGLAPANPSTAVSVPRVQSSTGGVSALLNAARAAVGAKPLASGGVQYIRFNGKTGECTFGADKSPVAVGTVFAPDYDSINIGWFVTAARGAADRGNNGVLFSDLRPMAQGYPIEDVPAFPAGSKIAPQLGIDLVNREGDRFRFEASSSSALAELATLADRKPAMVALTVRSFKTKDGDLVYVPKFTAVNFS